MNDRFSDRWFEDFFKEILPDNRINRRESKIIEFKSDFNWSNKEFRLKIAKSAAAFSNNRGGAIIFGVTNQPHVVVGVKGFYEVDDADISNVFNSYFSPHIDFRRTHFEYNELVVGILVIHESITKPICSVRRCNVFHESQIYYRYRAKSDIIKPGDLMVLMGNIRDIERNKWLGLFQNVSRIGVDRVGVLNTASGELEAGSSKFILDEALLAQIKFLNEYSLRKEGAPAIKIIGNVEEASQVIERAVTINEPEIFEAFLKTKLVTSAEEYIKAIGHLYSINYPIYFFIHYMSTHIERVAFFEK